MVKCARVNLLYVLTKLELGGAQKQVLSLIKGLDETRFNLFLFTAKEGILLPEALSIKGLKIKKSRFLERAINPLKDFLALIEIYWFIKKNNIEIVHTHSSKAGVLGRFAAKLARVKFIIHTVHGWSFNDYQPKFMQIFFIWLERVSAYLTHKLIVVSHYDQEKGLKNHIAREGQYNLIRYGIDYERFSKREEGIKKELGIEEKDLVVTNISCFKPQKSPLDFIKLASLVNKSVNGIKFLLVGDGILRKKIEGLLLKFGLQDGVILTGWRLDIQRILSITDVFALTSLWEGLPIAVLEAAASSMPVVATDTGAIREAVIDGKTGFLVLPGNMEAMSERLLLLLRDENRRRQMGQNAKNNLGFRFTLTNMLKDTQDLYDNL